MSTFWKNQFVIVSDGSCAMIGWFGLKPGYAPCYDRYLGNMMINRQTHLSAARKKNKINKCRSPWPHSLKKCTDCSSMARPILSAMRHRIPQDTMVSATPGCLLHP